jgi:hypothetical protein
LGCSFFNRRNCGSGLWIWRHRRSVGGDREDSVLHIPGAVHNFFDLRVAGQGGTLSRDWIVKIGVAEFPLSKAAKSKVPVAGSLGWSAARSLPLRLFDA